MQPLTCEFELATPTAIGHPWINMDGLVAHLAALDTYGREYLDLIAESTIRAPIDLDINVPLAETDGVRHASVSFFDDQTSFQTTIYKRFETAYATDVDSRKTKLRFDSGTYKHDVINLTYYPASTCTAYFGSTDAARLKRLFADHFTALGKKRSIGFGQVRNIEWTEIEEDRSLVDDGTAMRPIPAEKLADAERTEYISWKPPYWADENHTECAPPGVAVEW